MEKRILRRSTDGSTSGLGELHPLLQRVFAARDINEPHEIDKALSALLPYHNLLHLDQAVQRLGAAFEKQERIVIIGDFDADGATSTAVAVKALQCFGLTNVSYLVPNRFEYGYGLTPEIVEVAAEDQPDLIITVDNGISS